MRITKNFVQRLVPKNWLFLPLLLAVGFSTTTASAQPDFTSLPKRLPRFPGAVRNAPQWLNELNPPFDIRSYLAAPSPERNGATHYLLAMKDISTATDKCFDPRDLRSRERVTKRERQINQIFDLFSLYGRFGSMEAKETIAAELSNSFKRIETAQSLGKTVFQTDIEARPPHLDAALVTAKAYLIKTCVDANNKDLERCIDNVKRTLQLARDILPRGGISAAHASFQIEDIVCRFMVPIILMEKHETRPSYCDRLMRILNDHQNSRFVPAEIAIANEWLQIQFQLHKWDIEPRRMEALQRDSRNWFNQSYIAFRKPARQRREQLAKIHQELITPHQRRFEIQPLSELLWTESVIRTQTDLVITLCAVRHHYMTSRKIPRSLEKLFTDLTITAPPQDRLRMDPLKNIPIRAQFGVDFGVIHSVGVDGVDGDAKDETDDMAIRIETGAMIEFLYDPIREAAKPAGQ